MVETRTRHRRPPRSRRSPTATVAVLVLGPLAWVLHLTVSYWLVPVACRASHRVPLHATTAATAALAVAVTAWSWWRVSGGRRLNVEALDRDSRRPGDPAGTGEAALATMGFLLGAFFLVVVAVGGLAPVVVGPCR